MTGLILGHGLILGVAVQDTPLDSSGIPEEFWFNLKTGLVEFGKQSPASYRVGPFGTESEAKNALSLLAHRSKTWATEDESDS